MYGLFLCPPLWQRCARVMRRRESRQARSAGFDQWVLHSAFLRNGHDGLRLNAPSPEEIKQPPGKKRGIPAIKVALTEADQEPRSGQPNKSRKDRRKQFMYPSL